MSAEQFRAERRVAAARLRARGLSLRAIALRLNVSAPTIMEDLKVTMTTAPAAVAPAPAAPRRRYDEQALRLVELLKALGEVGLADAFADSRAMLARAAVVEAVGREDHAKAHAERDALIAKVAAGKLPLDRAVSRCAELAPWLSPRSDSEATLAAQLAGRVAAQLRTAARDSAKADGMGVHAALARLAAAAARRGVEAGGHFVDDRVLGALRAPRRADRLVGDGRGGLVELHDTGVPLPPNPPAAIHVEQFEGDSVLMRHWAQATAAAGEFQAVLAVAGLLHQTLGGRSKLFGADTDGFALGRITRYLPVQVHLAAYAALGWKPGLYVDLKPGERRPPAGSDVEIHGGIRYPVGWYAGLATATVGPPRQGG